MLKENDQLKSARLKQLTTLDSEGGLLPSGVQDVVAEFEQLIVWKVAGQGSNRVEVPEP